MSYHDTLKDLLSPTPLRRQAAMDVSSVHCPGCRMPRSISWAMTRVCARLEPWGL